MLSTVAHKNKKNIMCTRLEKQTFHCLCVQISETSTCQKVYLYTYKNLEFFFGGGGNDLFFFFLLSPPPGMQDPTSQTRD